MTGTLPAANSWYVGYPGFTAVRRSEAAAKAVLPTHGRPGHPPSPCTATSTSPPPRHCANTRAPHCTTAPGD